MPGQAVFPCLSYHLCHCPHSKPCGYSASAEAPDAESEEEELPAWSEPTHAKRGSVSDLKKESIRRQGRTRWMRGNKEGRIPVSYTGAGWPHMSSPSLASIVLRYCGRGFNCRNWFVTTRKSQAINTRLAVKRRRWSDRRLERNRFSVCTGKM